MRTVKEHDERRNEILDTAEALFLTKGYDKTTINDILKTIGIAKGTFYHYFKSKEEVMDAVIIRVVEQDILIAKEIAGNKKLSASTRIIQFFLTQSSDNNTQKNEMVEQFSKVENALMKQRALQASIENICPILAEIIEEGNQTKEFHTDYPLEAIQFLIAGIQSLVDDESIPTDQEKMARRLLSFIDIIFRVLGIDETKVSKENFTEQLTGIFER